MTARERLIARKILDRLHELEGGQETALQIHAAIGGLTVCGGAEFDAVLALLDAQKFLLSVPTRFSERTLKFNITDAGEAARLQL
jgi:hypothetical protein